MLIRFSCPGWSRDESLWKRSKRRRRKLVSYVRELIEEFAILLDIGDEPNVKRTVPAPVYLDLKLRTPRGIILEEIWINKKK